MRQLLAAAVVALICCQPAVGQDKSKSAPEAAKARDTTERVTRVYDIRDLVMEIRDYPLTQVVSPHDLLPESKPAAQPFGAAQEIQPVEGKQRDAQITSLLMETVAPESWRDAGGTLGSMRILEGQLIVTQSAENHQALEALIGQLRDHAKMVSVQAYWVSLDPNEVNSMVIRSKIADPIRRVDRNAIANIDPKRQMRAQITCYNNQLVHMTSGRARTAITNASPVVGSQAVGYDYKTAILHIGVSLEIRALVLPDGKTANVDVRSVVSEASDVDRGKEPVSAAADLDRLNIAAQELRSTLQMPVGELVLIGGMSDARPERTDGRGTYLLLEIVATPMLEQ